VAVAIGSFRDWWCVGENVDGLPPQAVFQSSETDCHHISGPRGRHLHLALIARSTFGTGAPRVEVDIGHAGNPRIQKMSPCVQFFRPEQGLIFTAWFGSGASKYQIGELPL
jgi:hypothetical protein